MATRYDLVVVTRDLRAPGAAGRSTPRTHRLGRYETRAEAEAERAAMPEAGAGVRYEIRTVQLPMAPEEFRATREAWGLSQQEMADELGVTQATVSYIESGSRPVTGRTLRALEMARQLRERGADVRR